MINISSKKSFFAIVLAFGIVLSAQQLPAQSNHELIAPVASTYPKPDDSGLPSYAMAAVSEEGKLTISTTRSISRTVPGEKLEVQSIEYQVRVPFMETKIVEGKPILQQSFKVLTKTRTVPGRFISMKEENHKTTEFEDHSFELVDGMTIDQAKKKLAGRTPVLLVTKGEKIHPFFQAIVKPDTLIVLTSKEEPKNDGMAG